MATDRGFDEQSLTDRYINSRSTLIYSEERTAYGSVSRNETRAGFIGRVIRPLEDKYGMITDDFLDRYEKGKLSGVGAADIFIWASEGFIMRNVVSRASLMKS